MNRDFISVANSPIHGTGVFAKQLIPKGTRIIAYDGLRLTVADYVESQRRIEEPQIYAISIDANHVIDGNVNGNHARFINHSCEPNCQALSFIAGQIHIYAVQDIAAGVELTFDYSLGCAEPPGDNAIDSTNPAPVPSQLICRCGATHCRGTMLAVDATQPKLPSGD